MEVYSQIFKNYVNNHSSEFRNLKNREKFVPLDFSSENHEFIGQFLSGQQPPISFPDHNCSGGSFPKTDICQFRTDSSVRFMKSIAFTSGYDS